MRSRWLWLLLVAVLGWVVWDLLSDGRPWLALGYGVLAVGIAWWVSPWRRGRPGPSHQEVLAMPEIERPVVVYWRPGCGFCAMLRSRLGADRDKAHWVNIWEDEEAAAFVRSVNDGNETVPTVVIDGQAHTNPSPDLVRDRLAEIA